MIFSERIKLAKRIDEFIMNKDISNTTFSVICILVANGFFVENAEEIHLVDDKLPSNKENEK